MSLALLLVIANVRPVLAASSAATTDAFVTGGGWIPSPAGAYSADPSLSGKATFGLVAKPPQNGAAPFGTTEFQLHGGFNFQSIAYDRLVISGARAQYWGTGAIAHRPGTLAFFVTVIDGDLIGRDVPDRFRINITSGGVVVYDNQPGASEDADPTMVLGGGSIVIHKGTIETPTNHPPIARAGADQTVAVGALATLDGSASSDPDGDALSYAWTLTTWPAGSTATLTGANTATPHFTPDIAGVYVVTLVVNDGALDSAPDDVAITAANTPPVAVDDAYATNEDTPLVVGVPGVLGNDSDAEGSPLTAALATGPAHGTLTLGADGSFTYTPAADFFGTDTFTYRASDGTTTSAVATVTITVTSVNDAPSAAPDAYTTNEDTALVVGAPGVLGNDSDIEGSALSAVLVGGPAHGTLTLGVDGSFTYTPAANFSGSDSFTYQSSDGAALSATVIVTLTVSGVNDAPVAGDDAVTTNEDTPVVIDVLANDSDVDGALVASSVHVTAAAAHGTTTVDAATGRITYTPAVNFNGIDSFTYEVCDGSGACDTATVAVTVVPVNDPPTVDAGPDHTLVAGGSVSLAGTFADADAGDTHTASIDWGDGSTTPGLVDEIAHTISATHVYAAAGSFTLTLTLTDSAGAQATDTAAVDVTQSNRAPVAAADSYTIDEDGVLTVAAPGVLANDGDADGDTLSAVLVTGPAHGTLTLGSDGSLSYTPAPNFFGSDSFTYQATDGTALSTPATVTVTVTAVNDAPVAADDAYATSEDTPLVIGAPGLLANDTDADGNPLSAVIAIGPAHGTLTLSGDGSFTYTPAADFSGTDTFTYRATDGSAASAAAIVTITVTAANDAPVAVADAYATNEDVPLVIGAPGVLGNDSDAEGSPLTAALASGPAHGTLTFGPDGSFSYTPAADFFGTDTFTYTASDGTSSSAPATVTITVNAVNDPPLARDDAANTNEDTPVIIDVLANDSDVEGGLVPSSVSIVVGALHGTTTIDPATGSVTYTPDANTSGNDTFTYRVCDASGDCDTALVSVAVSPVNDPPFADAGSDAIVTVGTLVSLVGSGSDPDGDTLTFAWTFILKPAGSPATLSGASTTTPSFTPDVPGLYRVQLTVTDSAGATATDTVDVSASGAITLAPDPLNLGTSATGSLTVTLSAPAGAGGQLVQLSTDSAIITIPASVLVLAGSTSASFDVTTGTTAGVAHVNANATGFAGDTATVNVAAGTLLIALEDELVGVGRTTNGFVALFTPAPAGGTVVTLVMADTGIATASPTTVSIAAGDTLGTFVVTGVAVGQTTLTGTAPGYTPADATVTVTDALISIGLIPEFGPDETEGVPISLTKPAPPGGLTITLVTDDPQVATVSPTVTVPAGQFLPPANPQVTGHALGTTQIVATAPGFAPGRRQVFVALALSFTPVSLSLGATETRNITVLLSHTAPVGGLTVQLTMDDPTRATVPATATFPAGQTSVVIPVTGVASGTTHLRANSPGIAEAVATIVVGAPITLSSTSIGKDLQVTMQAFLGAPAPAGNLPVTFTSSDASKLLVSSSQTAAGGVSTTVSAPAGQSTVPLVYFQALVNAGTVQVTSSAPGYSNGVSTLTLTPSGFWIFAPGLVQAFTTNSFALNTNVFLRSMRLNTNLTSSGADQEVRGGLTVNVDITSSVPSVGTITGSPVVYVGGTGSTKSAQFDPQGPGVTILSIPQPVPGFSIPSNLGQTVTATVTAPDVQFIGTTLSVGRDLQSAQSLRLESSPPGPVDITVSVAPGDEGIVTLSKTETLEGGSSVTFPGVTSTSQFTLYVQGRALGNTTLTATAAGYNDATLPVSVTPSGFWIFAPGLLQAFTTNAFAVNTSIFVRSYRLTSALASATEQEVRGGLSVNVDVTSSLTSVGTITTSPVVIAGGTGSTKSTQFDPQGAGVTTLSIPQPVPGFSIPTNLGQTVTATVIASKVLFSPTSTIVGQDLQVPVTVLLESVPPAPVDITVTVNPGDEALATISKVRTASGSNSVTFTGVTNTSQLTLYVQGRSLGSTQLIATAAGYTSAALPVSITPAGFWLFAPGLIQTLTTNTFAPPSSLFVRAERLTSTFTLAAEQELRGGLTADVELTSSNTTVGTITSPVHFAGGGASTIATSFDPQVVGTTTVSLTTPAGFSAVPVANRSVLVTVRAPEVRIASANVSSQRVGRDLQFAAQVTLENAPPEPVDVTLTVAPGGESLVTISKVQTAAGTNTLTFTGVTGTTVGTIYVQGRSFGSTAVTGVAAGYNDANMSVAVDPAGFRIYGPGFNTTVTTTASSANTTLFLSAHRLDPVTLNMVVEQEVRGGLTVNISVTSSNSAVGVVTVSPVVFQGGTSSPKTTAFDPISAGTAVVSIPAPVPGFSVPSNGSSTVTFTVNP